MKIKIGTVEFRTSYGVNGRTEIQRRQGEQWATVDQPTRRIVLDAMRLLRAQGFVNHNPFEAP